MSEAIYELKQLFKIAKDGEQVDCEFISLSAPNYNQISQFAPMKQEFIKAVRDATEGEEQETSSSTPSEEGAGLSASQCISIMYASKSCKMASVFVYAQELFRSGVALANGEKGLTIPMMAKMSVTDFEGLVGTYIANFIAPSLMDGQ